MFTVKHLPRRMNSLQNYIVEKLYTQNVLSVYNFAVTQGYQNTAWYDTARVELAEIAESFDMVLSDVCWITATLSPHLSWELNKQSLIAFLCSWYGLPCEFSNSAYGKNTHKCTRYMLGEIDGLPSGPKVSAFYLNLMGDYSALTIDRHAMRIALFGMWRITEETGEISPSVNEHRLITKAYENVSRMLGITAVELQAITWQVVAQKGKSA